MESASPSLTEMDVVAQLEAFRHQQPEYISPSFETVRAFATSSFQIVT